MILAGNADWELSAPLVSIPERSDLSLMLSPNPFNNRVNINFSLSRPGPVKLNIYDTQGREVDQVLDRGLNQGNHVFTWDYHTAGVYLVALDTGNNIVVRKVVCLP